MASCQWNGIGFDAITQARLEVAPADQIDVVLEQAFQVLFELCVLKQAGALQKINQQIDITGLCRLIAGYRAEHSHVGSAVTGCDQLQFWSEGLEF